TGRPTRTRRPTGTRCAAWTPWQSDLPGPDAARGLPGRPAGGRGAPERLLLRAARRRGADRPARGPARGELLLHLPGTGAATGGPAAGLHPARRLRAQPVGGRRGRGVPARAGP